jgi:zinc transporter, ZIP family
MAEAFFWGTVASCSLLIGCALALWRTIPMRPLGLIMAFGAGVLISAVAYELVEEAFDTSLGSGGIAVGFAAGSLSFYLGNRLLDRSGSGSATALVLGIVLDGIPESLVIGLTLLTGDGLSVAMLAAVFLSNLPESIAATSGLKDGGWRPRRIVGLWIAVVVVAGLSAAIGHATLGDASPALVAAVLAFAGGAILTMLAEAMIPEAFEHGGQLVGPVTSLGFALAFAIAALE